MKDIKVNVVETKPCSVTMDIEVPHHEILTETDAVYAQIQKDAILPGFRQGKAPMEMVKKTYEATAREKVIENLVQRSVFTAIKQKNLEPVDYPKVHDVCFEPEKPLKFKVMVEKHPEFKLKDYKGIKIVKEINIVDDKKIDETIEGLREKNSKLVESDTDMVNSNNFVMVDYSGFTGGVEIPELKAKNQLVDMSSAQMIAGFKEGLMGVKKGEEKEISVKFPKEAPNKALADKEVIFKVKVNEIKIKELPLVDDEFAKDFNFENLESLKSKIKENLELEETRRQNDNVKKQVIEHLLKEMKFEVPQAFVDEQYKHLVEKTKKYLSYQGIPEKELSGYIEKSKAKLTEEAANNVRLSYIINALTKEEKIEVNDEDMKKELEEIKKRNPGKEETAVKYFEKNKDSIVLGMKEEKIFKFLLDNAKIKEKTSDKD